jgi:hypothetical protein
MPDGLGMIQDVFDAAGTLGLAVGRLELQRDVSPAHTQGTVG